MKTKIKVFYARDVGWPDYTLFELTEGLSKLTLFYDGHINIEKTLHKKFTKIKKEYEKVKKQLQSEIEKSYENKKR